MRERQRPGFVLGFIFVLIGLWMLAVQLVPGLGERLGAWYAWPLVIVLVGACLLVLGLLMGNAEMAIPACIVAGIGMILYYQNASGYWLSWSYAWALIPGFVGVGVILSRLLGSPNKDAVRRGVNLILVSLVLFAVFGSIFGGFMFLGPYWPLMLVAAGLALLIQNIAARQK